MVATLTRAVLAETVYREIGLSQAESSALVDDVLEEIINALIQEEEVKISSFGSFRVRQKAARIGRNPKTKQEAVITPRKVVTFHASSLMKKAINGDGDAASSDIEEEDDYGFSGDNTSQNSFNPA